MFTLISAYANAGSWIPHTIKEGHQAVLFEQLTIDDEHLLEVKTDGTKTASGKVPNSTSWINAETGGKSFDINFCTIYHPPVNLKYTMTPKNFAAQNFVTTLTGTLENCPGNSGDKGVKSTERFDLDILDNQNSVILFANKLCAKTGEKIEIYGYQWVSETETDFVDLEWSSNTNKIIFYDEDNQIISDFSTKRKRVFVSSNENVNAVITGSTGGGTAYQDKVSIAFGKTLGVIKLEGFSIITKTQFHTYELEDFESTVFKFIEGFIEGKAVDENPLIKFFDDITSTVNKFVDALKIGSEFFASTGKLLDDIIVTLEVSGGVCDNSGNEPYIKNVTFTPSYSLVEYNNKHSITEFYLIKPTLECLEEMGTRYMNISLKAFENGNKEWISIQESYK
ncbi:hypothetical protein P0Y35_18690 [Kiritimatiellaeota bacterium B1221]|nr:hypothetical protein [Kiritimatiellaeota bacterium B1221]